MTLPKRLTPKSWRKVRSQADLTRWLEYFSRLSGEVKEEILTEQRFLLETDPQTPEQSPGEREVARASAGTVYNRRSAGRRRRRR